MKRALDIVGAALALVLVAPLMAVLALMVRLDSPGPTLFRQERVGRHGRPFRIYKFRSMVVGAASMGPGITAGNDHRITRVGRWLRATKLDELPQLWNVLRGDMSFVGPRPELWRYVELWPADARTKILSVRPGITDEAAVTLRHEERLLASVADPERYYVEQLLPQKVAMYVRYVDERSIAGDVRLVLRTLRAIRH